MSVNITEDYWTRSEFKSVWIKDAYLYREEYETKHTEYTIENKNKNDVDLVIEHPKNSAYDIVDTQKPTEETENFYRWKSKIKGKKQTKFVVKEGRTVSHSESIRNMALSTAEWYYNSKYIPKRTFKHISEIIELRMKIDTLNNTINELENERNYIFEEQERIRENLKSLSDSGEEERLRKKYVDELDKQENRLEDIKNEKEKLRREMEGVEKQIEKMLKGTILDKISNFIKGK